MNLLDKVKASTESPDDDNSYTQERYYEYMLRRYREEKESQTPIKSDLQREAEISDLKERIKKLEVDMAHVQLEQKTTLYG